MSSAMPPGPGLAAISAIPKHLKSAGGGIRGELSDRLALDALVAVPLEQAGMIEERREGDPRFLITLTTRLLPWS